MKNVLSPEIVEELKKRVKDKFASVENLTYHIRTTYDIGTTAGSLYKTISGQQESRLELCQAIAYALGFEHTDEAFPPAFLTKLKNGKTTQKPKKA